MFERQGYHFIALAAMLAGVYFVINPDMLDGEFLGIGTPIWLAAALLVPILHQVYVWLIWRAELHHKLITRWFGAKGFRLYAAGFLILFAARPLTILGLAVANRSTLPLNPVLAFFLMVLLFLPSAYLIYSVVRYFGLPRALGIDHFDESYRMKPFVRAGIFKYSANAMYTYGFLLLWIPGLIFFSQAALLAALFSHLYIWVHYYCTELPDIRRIYSSDPAA